MIKPKGYDEVQAGGNFEKLPAGGYVCRIMGVKETQSRTCKDMLEISLDIAEGDYKGYFADRYKSDTRNNKKWGCVVYQLVLDDEGNTNRGLKAFTTSVEESNSGFKIQWGDNFCDSLKSKLVGYVFGEEEYEKRSGKYAGEIGVIAKPKFARSVDKIRSGDYTVPEKKTLSGGSAGRAFSPVVDGTDDELPF